jgi:hypothetical protein
MESSWVNGPGGFRHPARKLLGVPAFEKAVHCSCVEGRLRSRYPAKAVLTELNMAETSEPTDFTAVTMTTAIKTLMKAYSIDVTPD